MRIHRSARALRDLPSALRDPVRSLRERARLPWIETMFSIGSPAPSAPVRALPYARSSDEHSCMQMRVTLAIVVVLGGLSLGCEEEAITVGRGMPAGGSAPAAVPEVAVDPSALSDAGIAPLNFRDEAFVEADTNRDPFRGFAQMFIARPTREPVQREVIMPRTSIDEMSLIAIVSGVANPSAMLVDRDGTGYTVRRGDYLGRPEVVQTGGESDVPITLNWRVDRIRAGEVVITREDPTAPNRPPLTRVLALHEEVAEPL